MMNNDDLRDLRDRRDALAEAIGRLRTRAFSRITVPPLERALEAMDAMLAQPRAARTFDLRDDAPAAVPLQ